MSEKIKLKEEILKIVTELNNEILKAQRIGINVSLNTKAINDGKEDFYVGVTFTITENI